MGRLIIDDTTIYELDEECMEQKKQEEDTGKAPRERTSRSRTSLRGRVKERPAL